MPMLQGRGLRTSAVVRYDLTKWLNLSFKYALVFRPGEDHIGSGIGVENLRRRLELIYPGAYTYEQSEEDGVYSVRIALKNLLG
jgi:hypothetical protein